MDDPRLIELVYFWAKFGLWPTECECGYGANWKETWAENLDEDLRDMDFIWWSHHDWAECPSCNLGATF